MEPVPRSCLVLVPSLVSLLLSASPCEVVEMTGETGWVGGVGEGLAASVRVKVMDGGLFSGGVRGAAGTVAVSASQLSTTSSRSQNPCRLPSTVCQ